MLNRLTCLLMCAFAVLVLACGGFTKKNNPGPVAESPQNVEKVELSELLADWKKNPVAVNERLKGKYVEVTGFVNEISGIKKQVYIEISPTEKREPGEPRLVIFLLNDDLVSQLKNYSVGSKISIQVEFSEKNAPNANEPRCEGHKIVPTRQEKATEPKKQPTPTVKEWTRAEFDKAVLGKTPAEIIALLGKPDQTSRGSQPVDADSPQFNGSLQYRSEQVRVVDPTSGKASSLFWIYFNQGQAKRVSY